MLDPLSIITLLNDKEILQAPIGGHMNHCPKCAQLQPHELIQVIERKPFTINQEHERPIHLLSICELCHDKTLYPPDTPFPCLERWNPNSNLDDYTRRSGYALDPGHTLLNDRSVMAMLESVVSMDAHTEDVEWKDYTLLILIFVASALVAGWAYSATSSTNHDTSLLGMFLLLGIPIGGFIGGILAILYRRKSRINLTRREELNSRLELLGIAQDVFVTHIPQEAYRNQKIYFLLKPYM